MIIIQFKKSYWTGSKFSNSKKDAMTFKSVGKAWNYVDKSFPVEVAEDCGLIRI